VTSVEPELKVFYIDFGNEEVCTPDQVKTMPSSIMDIPALVSAFLLSCLFSNSCKSLEILFSEIDTFVIHCHFRGSELFCDESLFP
jgi:hypothetical protein